MPITRRNALALLAALPAAGLMGPASAFAKDGDLYEVLKLMNPAGYPDKIILGPDTAPVTVIEYAALTCPHCYRFNLNTFPEVKKTYIDTGKVRYIIRPFPLGSPQTNPADWAMWMLTLAASDSFQALETFFSIQNQLFGNPKAGDLIQSTALQLGFTPETYKAVLSNQDNLKKLVAERQQAANDFGLQGTPTFYINGKMASGELAFGDLAKEIDPLLK